MDMLLPDVTIQPFDPKYQRGIDLMLGTIVPEYPEPFFHLPVRKIEELHKLPGRHYWVALSDGEVIGSIGVVVMKDYAVLKSLFVFKIWRGEEKGVANNLMKVATEKAKEEGCKTMYLGTMEQFKPAQRFYEKQGYERVDEKDLPSGFPHNDLDKVFFKKSI
ncbi:GNAT family N-acetyltransferase [Polluticoccus soli]|uniref:GNAT family N-acetyltransferase n=1 Tax=Polluticoccus soli TaxID=3034150 RepID=UPI0023E2CEA2|nr:GNAT family N-acetyltransferase [Flavipsychrobacter sp. JY13-12]